MPLRSEILAGNARLEAAANGAPSVKKAPPADDPDAVRRIQKALVALGFPLPISFPPGGEPDGKFGTETFNAVIAFQRHAFPGEPGQWDGRVGKNTLAAMDDALSADGPTQIDPVRVTTITKCTVTVA